MNVNARTDVAPGVQLDVRVVRPWYGIDRVDDFGDTTPEAKKGDAKIRALPNKTAQED